MAYLLGAGLEPLAQATGMANGRNMQGSDPVPMEYAKHMKTLKFEREKLLADIAARQADRSAQSQDLANSLSSKEALAGMERDEKAKEFEGSQQNFQADLGLRSRGLDTADKHWGLDFGLKKQQSAADIANQQGRLAMESGRADALNAQTGAETARTVQGTADTQYDREHSVQRAINDWKLQQIKPLLSGGKPFNPASIPADMSGYAAKDSNQYSAPGAVGQPGQAATQMGLGMPSANNPNVKLFSGDEPEAVHNPAEEKAEGAGAGPMSFTNPRGLEGPGNAPEAPAAGGWNDMTAQLMGMKTPTQMAYEQKVQALKLQAMEREASGELAPAELARQKQEMEDKLSAEHLKNFQYFKEQGDDDAAAQAKATAMVNMVHKGTMARLKMEPLGGGGDAINPLFAGATGTSPKALQVAAQRAGKPDVASWRDEFENELTAQANADRTQSAPITGWGHLAANIVVPGSSIGLGLARRFFDPPMNEKPATREEQILRHRALLKKYPDAAGQFAKKYGGTPEQAAAVLNQ